MRNRKFFKKAAYTLLVLFILINAVCVWQAFTFTHFSNKKVTKQTHSTAFEKKFDRIFGKQHPRQLVVDSLTVPHQTLFIQSDTLKLAAWYLKHNGDSAVKGTVVMFHGYESSRSELIPEATAFYKMQYNVFMIDFRGHGLSQGDVCSMGYHEADDVRAAYYFIKNTGEKNIVLWGSSMGAASVTKAMHDDPQMHPSKIILEKSFGVMTDAAEGLVRNSMHEPEEPLATILTFWGSAEQGIWMFKVKPEIYVKGITCPALVQWGDRDENVSRAETESIYKNLGSTKKQLVVYPGCRHENLLLKNPTLWEKSVSNFLNS
ncbi:MAG: alpha/beta fold hydrolase [Parafilimonas sp.]